ncbi:GrpB family protein [Aspergillus stella-maris]|uniref:GrpB family protein n=1 Tax=Aspergillus stella-maris TaxID=1810926 RepID=UPI003CCE111A
MASPSTPLNPDIIQHIPYDPADIEVVSTRPQKRIEIVEADPTWPLKFAELEALIKAAFSKFNSSDNLLYIQHVGSTSVPNLPAKAVIDIDIVVSDPEAEQTYVPALENAGFQFLHREPKWHQHRFFGLEQPHYANLHVFGPGSPEAIRHRLFRDWLRNPNNQTDRDLYADAKRRAAGEAREREETVQGYTDRKEPVIRDILKKIYREHGLLKDLGKSV